MFDVPAFEILGWVKDVLFGAEEEAEEMPLKAGVGAKTLRVSDHCGVEELPKHVTRAAHPSLT